MKTAAFSSVLVSLACLVSASVFAMAPTGQSSAKVTPDMIQTGSDIPAHWTQPEGNFDYVKRDVMIPMRDGVKLHTVILIPKGAHDLPMLLERTPYNASGFVPNNSPHMADAVWSGDKDWADGSYILVWQDVRGKYGSEGKYIMTRPPMGPLNPTKTDDTTDAWDTIDWLVKNITQSNGKVGMIGSSYDGWTVAMALLHPNPALKVAAPESPMIDGWMGDDWYHYGALRQVNLDYFTGQTTRKGKGESVPRDNYDDYTNFLEAGSAGDYADAHGFKQLPWWNRFAAHPAYDAFWQLQALDKLLPEHPSNVPTMWLQGLWDQEDIYGAIHAWEALTKAGHGANNHLVIGPWWHSQINRQGWHLGPLKWPGDTAAEFRRTVMIPWFNHYLRGTPMAKPLPQAMIYNAVEKRWDRFSNWKVASAQQLTPIYLQADMGLGFQQPAGGGDSYVSDPAKPVPYLPRPIPQKNDNWRTWLVHDQRFVADRPDVLSYTTPVLTKTVTLQGAPIADIFAKTTGTDGDFVVKLIDVYPGTDPSDPTMGGYELPISLDIFRGRYRKSFADPSPIPANVVQEYKFRLPSVNYEFKPGHRIMVQIQSSLFPLYDRNPQTYVPNILFAKPADYKKATVTIEHGPDGHSAVLLPVVAHSTASH
ncbi:CocE/NonD family hydrolase [Rhodanobacter sp. 115]|uniref:CocE/NonD family hydrolase n=1 Tax=Rhodanobacter sp. FW021-MT20 TaxID=1162282 RepID=UPI000260C63A|nr:CocE/NonD family hydrolase [Rhodanobacter sp. 115]EIL87072.1 putative hydrolase, CocE/NonD family protein [Rhodanobacter sp. 115]